MNTKQLQHDSLNIQHNDHSDNMWKNLFRQLWKPGCWQAVDPLNICHVTHWAKSSEIAMGWIFVCWNWETFPNKPGNNLSLWPWRGACFVTCWKITQKRSRFELCHAIYSCRHRKSTSIKICWDDWLISIKPVEIFIELDDGKIYRKPLYLMVKTMVSCKFSLKPIQWNIDQTSLGIILNQRWIN